MIIVWFAAFPFLLVPTWEGQILGKPKGTIQKSKFDKHAEKIKELLDYGLSVRKISSVLEYTNHIALNTYINKRNLKKKLQTT